MSRTMPLLSVVIVTWNSRRDVEACLDSLAPALSDIPHEIIVVDNASSDGTADWIGAARPAVRLERLPCNAGYAAAANVGLGTARGEFIWLLNPDTVVSPQTPARLIEALRARPRAGAAGPRLLCADGRADPRSARRFPTLSSDLLEKAGLRRLALQAVRLPLDVAGPVSVPLVSGAAMCLRRTVVEQVGGLDSSYFLYGEDLDLCRRLSAAGWEIFYCGDASLLHHGGHSAAQAEAAGIEAILSMQRYLARYAGRPAMWAYRAGISALSLAKLGVFSARHLLARSGSSRGRAAQKVRLHRRLLRALWSRPR